MQILTIRERQALRIEKARKRYVVMVKSYESYINEYGKTNAALKAAEDCKVSVATIYKAIKWMEQYGK